MPRILRDVGGAAGAGGLLLLPPGAGGPLPRGRLCAMVSCVALTGDAARAVLVGLVNVPARPCSVNWSDGMCVIWPAWGGGMCGARFFELTDGAAVTRAFGGLTPLPRAGCPTVPPLLAVGVMCRRIFRTAQ